MPDTAITAGDVRRLAAEGESQTVEFKLALPPERVLAAHIVAFANATGGVLLVGINEKGELSGLSESECRAARNRLQRVVSSLLPYPAGVGTVVVEGKNIVYAAISKAPPHLEPIVTATGEIYQRFGGISRRVMSDVVDNRPQHGDSAGPTEARSARVFVAMSFREEEEPALVDYLAAINRAARQTGLPLEIVRMDLVDGDYEISQEIMRQIDSCDIVITDFTLSPSNVYFELGYARGSKDKQIIQTARKGTQLAFDVRNWRTEFYRNATELEEKLKRVLAEAYGRLGR